MSDNKQRAIMDEVALGLLATGEWRKPSFENGLMKLKTIKGGHEFRIDLTPTLAMIFAVEYGVVEQEWVEVNAADILDCVARQLAEFRAGIAA